MKIKIVKFQKEDTAIIHDLFPEDWHFNFFKFINVFLSQPNFEGFSIYDGNILIGFGNLFFFNQIGWIGNIIVKKAYRNRGIGTGITKFLVEFGEKTGIKTFCLIATDLGVPIYKKIGFEIDEEYGFFNPGIKGINKISPQIEIHKAGKNNFEKIENLDCSITGEKRAHFLSLFQSETYFINDDMENVRGFYIKNLGDGLVLADDPEYGIELLKYKIINNGFQIVIPLTNTSAIKYIEQIGYERYKKVPRMILGEKMKWKPDSVYCRGTGYLG